jgi:hypothetical protein
MEFVRAEVTALPKDLDEEEADRRVVPVVKAHYPGWDNEKWIPFAIRIFSAEAAGRAPKLPSQ